MWIKRDNILYQIVMNEAHVLVLTKAHPPKKVVVANSYYYTLYINFIFVIFLLTKNEYNKIEQIFLSHVL